MKEGICALLGMLCFICAALATPIAIVYGVYQWVIIDIEFKLALWAGLKTWVAMLLLLIPGFIFYALSEH